MRSPRHPRTRGSLAAARHERFDERQRGCPALSRARTPPCAVATPYTSTRRSHRAAQTVARDQAIAPRSAPQTRALGLPSPASTWHDVSRPPLAAVACCHRQREDVLDARALMAKKKRKSPRDALSEPLRF